MAPVPEGSPRSIRGDSVSSGRSSIFDAPSWPTTWSPAAEPGWSTPATRIVAAGETVCATTCCRLWSPRKATPSSPCSRAPQRLRGPTTRCCRRWRRDAAARVLVDEGASVRVNIVALGAEPLALQRRVLQTVLAQLSGRPPSFGHVDAALRFLGRGRDGVVTLHGVQLELSGGQGVLSSGPRRRQGPPSFGNWCYRLRVPGELAVLEAGMRIEARVVPVGRMDAIGARSAVVALPDTSADLVVRAWQPGDRMRLPGGSGRKKVQDLFVDRKVPRAERHRVPIVATADGRIVWVAGHAVAGGFGVTDATKSVVVLSFELLGGNE